jgi:adenine deaminase
MSRRLNQEAAKAVKYGDVTEEEAWKMVTLNPAKLLHLDGNIGSVKEGKIADLVLWSGHPMSIYTKAEKTLIEGAIYFDINTDLASRNSIEAERNKLIKLMAKEKSGGAQTQAILRTNKPHMHCDYLD